MYWLKRVEASCGAPVDRHISTLPVMCVCMCLCSTFCLRLRRRRSGVLVPLVFFAFVLCFRYQVPLMFAIRERVKNQEAGHEALAKVLGARSSSPSSGDGASFNKDGGTSAVPNVLSIDLSGNRSREVGLLWAEVLATHPTLQFLSLARNEVGVLSAKPFSELALAAVEALALNVLDLRDNFCDRGGRWGHHRGAEGIINFSSFSDDFCACTHNNMNS